MDLILGESFQVLKQRKGTIKEICLGTACGYYRGLRPEAKTKPEVRGGGAVTAVFREGGQGQRAWFRRASFWPLQWWVLEGVTQLLWAVHFSWVKRT